MRHKDEHLVNRRLLFIWWTKKGTFYVVYLPSPPSRLAKPLIPILGNPWPQRWCWQHRWGKAGVIWTVLTALPRHSSCAGAENYADYMFWLCKPPPDVHVSGPQCMCHAPTFTASSAKWKQFSIRQAAKLSASGQRSKASGRCKVIRHCTANVTNQS